MIEIKDLLIKFDKILLSEEIKKSSIIKIFKDVIGIDIDPKDVKIKNNIIYLNIKPIYKNEIFIKKELIFSKLNNILGKKAPNKLV